MAQDARKPADFDDEGANPPVARFLVWAGLAAVAMGSAALAAQTHTGAQRLASLLGRPAQSTTAPGSMPVPAARTPEGDLESRRITESLRLLAADRDRLLARVDTLERNLDLTGSLPRESAALAPAATLSAGSSPMVGEPAAGPSLPPNWSLIPTTLPPAAGVPAGGPPPAITGGIATTTAAATAPSGIQPAAGAPAAQASSRGTGGLVANEQGAESVATRTEFAVDVGGDWTFDGLRAQWASLRSTHGGLFEGLRPVVAVREGTKPGALELRLVVGPLTNAAVAARLCATLVASGLPCQTTVFDGQRLALR